MKAVKLLGIGVAFGLAGCGGTANTPKAAPPTAAAKAAAEEHEHGAGPHGGTIIELGKYHGEFTVDHPSKTATVYILDGKEAKTPAPVAAAKLTLSVKSPAFTADLLPKPQAGDPAGKSSRFVATHDALGKEQEFEGSVSGELDGKPAVGDFKEEEHKDHKHDKKK